MYGLDIVQEFSKPKPCSDVLAWAVVLSRGLLKQVAHFISWWCKIFDDIVCGIRHDGGGDIVPLFTMLKNDFYENQKPCFPGVDWENWIWWTRLEQLIILSPSRSLQLDRFGGLSAVLGTMTCEKCMDQHRKSFQCFMIQSLWNSATYSM